jgi:methionyl-tRNA formyltransferase
MVIGFAGSDRPLAHRIRNYLSTRLGQQLQSYDVGGEYDLVISVLSEHIFTQGEIDAAPRGIVNLHPAPLPEYRGCNSYSHAILNGDTKYAVTLHYVDAGIDTGPVIAQEWLPIVHDDTAWSLYERAQRVAFEMFAHEWPKIINTKTRVPAIPQEMMGRDARYYRRNSLDVYRRALTFPGKEPWA